MYFRYPESSLCSHTGFLPFFLCFHQVKFSWLDSNSVSFRCFQPTQVPLSFQSNFPWHHYPIVFLSWLKSIYFRSSNLVLLISCFPHLRTMNSYLIMISPSQVSYRFHILHQLFPIGQNSTQYRWCPRCILNLLEQKVVFELLFQFCRLLTTVLIDSPIQHQCQASEIAQGMNSGSLSKSLLTTLQHLVKISMCDHSSAFYMRLGMPKLPCISPILFLKITESSQFLLGQHLSWTFCYMKCQVLFWKIAIVTVDLPALNFKKYWGYLGQFRNGQQRVDASFFGLLMNRLLASDIAQLSCLHLCRLSSVNVAFVFLKVIHFQKRQKKEREGERNSPLGFTQRIQKSNHRKPFYATVQVKW